MGGQPSMIMQWYENGNAAEYLSKKNPLADRVQLVRDSLDMVLGVAKGLEYLHTLRPPIIHGDLKGNNVLIADDGRAVLCDFGLSKVIEELGQPSGLTISNPAAGPIRWQAPELMQDDDAEMTLASDVWSFACTAFEILSGVMPYSHRTKDALVLRDMAKRCKPSSQNEALLAQFPTYVLDVLDRCWSFSPCSRPTMSAVVEDLASQSSYR
ncbi:kinase-like domain-containing protein [Coprinopsis sp. MPI-PUGE-AT-0042]|nr:kinase-like domain-containing protein [Coprinopsis sp. MPI-PUGE-AT-0042]